MKTVLNILWVVLVGVWAAIEWVIIAAIIGMSVVGLPVARQCLKMAHFTLWPFGREAVSSPTASRLSGLGNVFWFIPGLVLAFTYAFGGLLLCMTVVGIPFGTQAFKFAGLSLSPFGKEIVRTKDLRSGAWVQRKAVETGAVVAVETGAGPETGS